MTALGGSDETITDVQAVVPRDPAAGLSRGDILGRYVVLDRLGAGAMGQVYTAFDPELDRKVAVKLLHGGHRGPGTAGTTRLLREAQALAKLNHPSVVTVHDVGRTDLGGGRGKSVWIAMELVDGLTLTKWLAAQPREWTEILDVLAAVAVGLAAAHDNELVHRDVKPDNVMIGNDGRVRVMDFGLARGTTSSDSPDPDTRIPKDSADEFASGLASQRHLDVVVTRAGATPGTPAYMSPEQISGMPPDARSDQFSYCVMLWEALYGERPFLGASLPELADKIAKNDPTPSADARRVPRWLSSVIRRGLAVDPNQRWPSLPALLEGIERGRRGTRRRRAGLIVGGIAVLGAGVLGGWMLQDNARVAACEAHAATLDEIWNDDARARVAASLHASGAGNAETTVTKVMPWLDDHARKWKAARTEACVEKDDGGIWTEQRTERSLWCLGEHERRFAAIVERLQTADTETVTRAVRAASNPSGVEACRDVEAIDRLPTPPTDQRQAAIEVGRARSTAEALKAVGRYDDALATSRQALDRALEVGWTPLVHDLRVLVGEMLHITGDTASAESVLEAAYFGAMSERGHDVALRAAFVLILIANDQARYDDAERWSKHARLLLYEIGGPQPLRQMMLLNRIATTQENSGDYRAAVESYRQALELVETTLGDGHPEVGDALGNLAQALHTIGQEEEAIALHTRALTITEAVLGPDHPHVANILNNLANVRLATGDARQAATLLERCVEIHQAALGPAHPRLATCLSNLANTHRARGDNAQAATLHERALAIREAAYGPDHPEVAQSLNNLGIVRKSMGDLEGATAMYRRAIEVWTAVGGPEHPQLAAPMTNLGNLRARAGAYEEAQSLHARAIEIWTKALGPDHPHIASATNNLADAHRLAGDLVRARELYDEALALRERTLGPEHPMVSSPLVGLIEIALEQGRNAEVIALAERVIARLEDTDAHPTLLAAARFALARALVATGGDPTRAKGLATLAAETARQRPDSAEVSLDAIEGWMAEHDLAP